MDFQVLGIGPLELIFFVVLLLLLFGPHDLARMARSFGRFVNRLVRSENYQVIQKTSAELRNLPARIVREAQLDEVQKIGQAVAAEARVDLAPTAPPAARPDPAPTAPQTDPAPTASGSAGFAAWNHPPKTEVTGQPAPAPGGDAFRAWTRDLTPPGDKPAS